MRSSCLSMAETAAPLRELAFADESHVYLTNLTNHTSIAS